MTGDSHYDVIVIGVGSMGSAACYYLSKRGLRVLGIERFSPPHELGSHGGESRIIRKAYFEHPDYVPLLHQAYNNWREIEERTNAQIYFETGITYFGKANSATLLGVRHAAEAYGLRLNPVDQFKAKTLSPFENIEGYEAVFEPQAGFLKPDVAITSYLQEAISLGAVIHTNEVTQTWLADSSHVTVSTDKKKYTASKIVITAGSWTARLMKDVLAPNLEVTRQTLAWFNVDEPERFTTDNFSCWFIENDDGLFYGFPIVSPRGGLKVALHKRGRSFDPNETQRDVDNDDVSVVQHFMQKHFSSSKPMLSKIKTCLYTYSDDENFIIDHLPGTDERVVIACGFSGHGFKFASAVGEILADLMLDGKTKSPIEFLSLRRFRK